jgi:hypothetical protein
MDDQDMNPSPIGDEILRKYLTYLVFSAGSIAIKMKNQNHKGECVVRNSFFICMSDDVTEKTHNFRIKIKRFFQNPSLKNNIAAFTIFVLRCRSKNQRDFNTKIHLNNINS